MSPPAAGLDPLGSPSAPDALPAMPHHAPVPGNAAEGRREADLPGLLAGCARGENAAWSEFLHRFGGGLRYLAWKALYPDPFHLEDVVQEVLLRLVKGRGKLRAERPDQVVYYLRRTVASVVTDLERHRTAGKRTRKAVRPPRHAPSNPEQELVQKDSYLHLLDQVATGRHPHRDRRILHGWVIEGHTSREIAPQVGLSPSGVDSALNRIRQRQRNGGGPDGQPGNTPDQEEAGTGSFPASPRERRPHV